MLGRGYWERGGMAVFEVPFLRRVSSAVPLRKDALVSYVLDLGVFPACSLHRCCPSAPPAA